MRTSKKHRTPVRPPAAGRGPQPRPADSDDDASSKPLSAQQIPVLEDRDFEIPSELESAEALGFDEEDLHAEIRSEELQRHPDAHDNDEDLKSLEGMAGELHRRLSGDRSP